MNEVKSRLAGKKLFPVILIFLLACNQNEKSNPLGTKLDEYLSGQAKYFRFNGNVLVADKGKIIYQKSFGFADFDSQRMLNDSSVFELASVSKQFTATGILLLIDKGKLSLTDSLRKFFPELPYSNITIRHMLTHTSGLPDYFWLMIEKWDHKKIAYNQDVIELLAKEKLPPVFAPGTRWEYSNTAFVILATIIEKISGQSFKDYMRENIFQPLEMKYTRIYNTRRSLKETIPNYAYGFNYNDSLKKYVLPDNDTTTRFVIYMDGIQGDGIVNSTTGDLLKWDRAVKNHRLLKEATQNEMLKGQELADTLNKTYYGYGVGVGKNETGNFISHSGGWPGYTTFLYRNTDADRTMIILSNNNSNSPAISGVLEKIILDSTVIMPYEHKEIVMDTLALDKFTGNYQATVKITLERKGTKLFRVLPNGSSLELKPESATKFFYGDGSDRQIEFEIGADKKITKAWLISLGVKTELKKL